MILSFAFVTVFLLGAVSVQGGWYGGFRNVYPGNRPWGPNPFFWQIPRSRSQATTTKCKSSLHSDYSYKERDQWPTLYPTCNGRNQSPVNIDLTRASSARFYTSLNLNDYRNEINSAKMENNGHTVVITVSNVNIYVTGGPANDNRYRLESFHVHFGKHDREGSEHFINKRPYAMEIHFVHRNTKYPNLEIASGMNDGLLVLGVLVHVAGHRDNTALSFLTDKLQIVKDPRSRNSTVVRGIQLTTMLGHKHHQKFYFTYFGSLTTPTCNEAVTWVVLIHPIRISHWQMKQFRLLLDYCGNPIAGNFRPLQNLNGRVIKRVSPKY